MTLTHKFNAYKDASFLDIMNLKTISPINYYEVRCIIVSDMKLGLALKQEAQGLLDTLSAIMN